VIAVVGLTVAIAPAPGQGRGGMVMGAGMMGMPHDSATMAQMGVIHQLVANHERITRTVTNLTDGIRTVTESADPKLAGLIRDHVATMDQRVGMGDDPALPMESPALRTIFRGRDKIRTTTTATPTGIVVVQTSSDSAIAIALQQHAAEVTDLVQRGMAAMHEAMVKGVDEYTSTPHFEAAPDGGRIELQRDFDDTAGAAAIRRHLQDAAAAFATGNFSVPGFMYMQEVPGTKVMAAKRDAITYSYHELSRGGEIRILTKDADAIAAVHAFLAFQQREHRMK
jgi:hypothetical protein